jgi:hypothetical protein
MEINVKKIRPFTTENNPRLLAFADVEVGEILIRDFRILLDDDGNYKLAFPQNERSGPDGIRRYGSLISTTLALKMKIQEVVIEGWKAKNLLKETNNVENRF